MDQSPERNRSILDYLRDIYWKIKVRSPKNTLKNITAILVILRALPVFVVLAEKVPSYRSKAALNPASLYINPASANSPPETTASLMVNTSGNSLAFSAIEIRFDPSVLQISSEVTTSSFFNPISVTSQSDANLSGKIDVVLGLSPQNTVNPPSGSFGLARFNILPKNSTPSPAYINWFPTQIQLVDINGNIIPNSTTPMTLSLNPATPTLISSPISSVTPTKAVSQAKGKGSNKDPRK